MLIRYLSRLGTAPPLLWRFSHHRLLSNDANFDDINSSDTHRMRMTNCGLTRRRKLYCDVFDIYDDIAYMSAVSYTMPRHLAAYGVLWKKSRKTHSTLVSIPTQTVAELAGICATIEYAIEIKYQKIIVCTSAFAFISRWTANCDNNDTTDMMMTSSLAEYYRHLTDLTSRIEVSFLYHNLSTKMNQDIRRAHALAENVIEIERGRLMKTKTNTMTEIQLQLSS